MTYGVVANGKKLASKQAFCFSNRTGFGQQRYFIYIFRLFLLPLLDSTHYKNGAMKYALFKKKTDIFSYKKHSCNTVAGARINHLQNQALHYMTISYFYIPQLLSTSSTVTTFWYF